MSPDSEEQTPTDGVAAEIADLVDEMVDESFPASDPPSGWAGQDPRDVVVPDGDHAELPDGGAG